MDFPTQPYPRCPACNTELDISKNGPPRFWWCGSCRGFYDGDLKAIPIFAGIGGFSMPVFRNHEPKRVKAFGSAQEEFSGSLDLAAHLCPQPNNTIFAMMSGDAMEGFRIPDGALLIIETRTSFSVGQIVLVETEEGLILRKLTLVEGKRVLADGLGRMVAPGETARMTGLLRWSAKSWDEVRTEAVPVR
jgi:hypothetical protein